MFHEKGLSQEGSGGIKKGRIGRKEPGAYFAGEKIMAPLFHLRCGGAGVEALKNLRNIKVAGAHRA